MATFTKTAVLLALALSAGSAFAAAKPATQTISTLGGKFTFSLPKAYAALDGECLRRRFSALAGLLEREPEIRVKS